MRRAGRLAQGLVVLLWAGSSYGIDWTVGKACLACATVLGAASLFFGLVVLQATLAFWTTESLEIMNTVTHGGVETAQYPLPIYRPWFRRFFTFVVPLAFANYFPAIAILDRPDPLGMSPVLGWIAPLVCLAFWFLSLQVWKFGVRHYASTGS